MGELECVVITSSTGSQLEANKIAESLVEKKLAACVQIVPGVTSHYRWEGKSVSSYEVIMIIKALRKNFEAIKEEIFKLHSFEMPEIVMTQVIGGCDKYLDWIRKESI